MSKITFRYEQTDRIRERYSTEEEEVLRRSVEVQVHNEEGLDELFDTFRGFLQCIGYHVPSGEWRADENDTYREEPGQEEWICSPLNPQARGISALEAAEVDEDNNSALEVAEVPDEDDEELPLGGGEDYTSGVPEDLNEPIAL